MGRTSTRAAALGILIALTVAGGIFGPTGPRETSAAAFTVTKTADTNDGACNADCSLREAVVAANALAGHDNISIPAGNYALTGAAGENASATGDLDVTDSVSFNGSGMTTTQINGSGIENTIEVFDSAATLILTDLSVGNATGDGVHAAASNLSLLNVVVGENTDDGVETTSGNVELVGGWVAANLGDGIVTTSGNVTVTRSTISNNGDDGVETSTGNIVTTNSTISTNTSDGLVVEDANITVNWSTVALNQSEGVQALESGLLVFHGALVANNADADCSPTVEASDNSMDTDGSCDLSAGEVSNGTANLGPLQNNGGTTLTHALLTGSDAIDAGGTSCPEDDQRGTERFQGAACDIGAYEGVSTAPTSTPTSSPTPQATPTPCNGPCPTATPTSETIRTHTPTITNTPAPTGTAAVATATAAAATATANTGGQGGDAITPPDTGSGPGDGGGLSGSAMLVVAVAVAMTGLFGITTGKKLHR